MVVPLQIVAFAPSVMVGAAVMVTVIGVFALVQPVVELLTLIVALYVPVAAPAGTAIAMGDAPNAALVTFTNPAVIAAALKVIVY